MVEKRNRSEWARDQGAKKKKHERPVCLVCEKPVKTDASLVARRQRRVVFTRGRTPAHDVYEIGAYIACPVPAHRGCLKRVYA